MSQISYTREELEQMDIFAIRAIARNAGISSPTKKNKMELVNMIVSVANGEVLPPPPVRGRPPKPIKTEQEETDESFMIFGMGFIEDVLYESSVSSCSVLIGLGGLPLTGKYCRLLP